MYLNENNLSAEERYDVEYKTRNNPRARYFTMNGKTQSVRAWSCELGLSHNTIYERIKSGLTFEQAVSAERMATGRKAAVVEIDGESHTVQEWSDITGVPVHKYYYRKRCGWSDSDIFKNKLPESGGDAFGKHLTARKWSDITGIRYATICTHAKNKNLESYLRSVLNKEIKGETVATRLSDNGIKI